MTIPHFLHASQPVISPNPACEWASTMVLNPGIIDDGEGRWHMLFRASGPYPQKSAPGKEPAYPIFLGYAYSDDNGESWHPDFDTPALAPTLEYDPEKIYTTDGRGERCINYANGCIEDPRLFRLNGKVFLTVACRVFAVGAYWIWCRPNGPKPNSLPDWIFGEQGKRLGRGVYGDVTVNLLYEVNLPELARRRYDRAFRFISILTDPEYGENRDVMFFPEKMTIRGKSCYVMFHRPVESFDHGVTPGRSIWIAAAEDLYDFAGEAALQQPFACARFGWEADRIAASWPPIRINEREWLLAYHGKQDETVGYTQSFMILEERPDAFPVITHRVSERWLFASEKWEQSDFLGCPCLFSCSGILRDGELVMGYGAADEMVGIVRTDWAELIRHIRGFDTDGNRTA